jgi:putative inorganic carbon (hco3(-)) transporter
VRTNTRGLDDQHAGDAGWRGWAAPAAVLATAVAAPFLLAPTPGRLAAACVVLAAAGTTNLVATRRPFATTPLNPLFGALVVMMLVSAWATFDLRFSLGKIGGTLLGLAFSLAVIGWARDDRRLGAVLGGFLACGVGVAAVALVGTSWEAKFRVLAPVVRLFPVRIHGIPGAEDGFNANPVGGTLVLVLPVALLVFEHLLKRPAYHAAARRAAALVFALGVCLPLGFTLLLTQSRGAWLGFASACGVVALARWRPARWIAAVAAPVGAVWLWYAAPWAAVPDTRLFAGMTGTAGELTLAGRLEIWSRAVAAIRDFPITGVGMNAFRRVVPTLYPLFSLPPDHDIAAAHNRVLQTALDLGVPGMVADVAILVAVAAMLVLVWRATASAWRRALALGLLAGWCAQFVYQINDAIPLGAKVGVFSWMALALAASLFTTEYRDRARSSPAWQTVAAWLLVSILAVAFITDFPRVGLLLGVSGAALVGLRAVRAV